jgi:hypothetical protein
VLGRPNDLATRDDYFAPDGLREAGAGAKSSDPRWIRGEERRGTEAADCVGEHAVNGTVRFPE